MMNLSMTNLQAMVNGWNQEWQRQRAETQLTLGGLIEQLKALSPERLVVGLGRPRSYRGYYCDMLSSAPSRQFGRVTFESQGPKEDAYHQLEYARVLLDGSQWVPDAAFRNWLETGLRFDPKKGSHPLELADFLSRDLFEWIKADCTGQPKWWGAYSGKVYARGDMMMGKFGIKVFPDSAPDIRERVLAHREWCRR